MTTAAHQEAWLENAARIVAFPGEADDSASGELASLLVRGEAGGQAAEILEDREPRERIAAWAAHIAKHSGREGFWLFAYSPGQVLGSFPGEIHSSRRWSTLVELYEAWSDVLAGDGLDAVDSRSRRIGSAYLARTRWLLLSIPFRDDWRGQIPVPDLKQINAGSDRIATLARRARDEWLEVLGQIDDYPKLKTQVAIEDEAREIAALEITRRRLSRVNPGLGAVASPAEEDLAGDEVSRFVITRLLLPRFALLRVWRMVYGSVGAWARGLSVAAGVAFLGTLVALIVGLWAPGTGVLAWAWTGVLAFYGLIAASAAVDPATAWPWLMRQPASAIGGLVALIAAPSDWWRESGSQWGTALWAVLLMTGAGLGYLFFEAGNQDVRGFGSRAWRSLLVGAFGYLHALMVSVIGLRFLLPAFAAHASVAPARISCWVQASGCGPAALPAWLIVLAAASWSFAAAVFLQIIWDDQPVTAPLAHVSWHSKG